MAKAATSLSTTSTALNRRRLLSGASLAAALAIPTAAHATAPASIWPPTGLGREYLATLTSLRAAWAKHDGSDIEDGQGEAPRIEALDARIDDLESSIAAKPVREFPDIVDRAIVARYASTFSDDTDRALSLIAGVLGLAGIEPSECEVNV